MATRREQRWKLLTEIARRADDLLYPEAGRLSARSQLDHDRRRVGRREADGARK